MVSVSLLVFNLCDGVRTACNILCWPKSHSYNKVYFDKVRLSHSQPYFKSIHCQQIIYENMCKFTSIIVELCNSFPANIIFMSSGNIPIWDATISFTFFMSHFGSKSTGNVLPVLVFTYMLNEFVSFRLPNQTNCSILRNTLRIKPKNKLIPTMRTSFILTFFKEGKG